MHSDNTHLGCFSGLFRFRKVATREDKTSTGLKSKPAAPEECRDLGSCCSFSYTEEFPWDPAEDFLPAYSELSGYSISESKVVSIVDDEIDKLNNKLRILSLKIHGHPELNFEEIYAHDLLTDFMSKHGFHVTKHYLGMKTAWRAEFTHGNGGRVLGINSEMDALKGIGHACGHNLIAVSGCGVALAVKAALEAHNIPGKVVLLGTPAEEGGGGKAILLERGAYKGMDVCVMCHPGSGPDHAVSIGPTLALQALHVEYFGHTAHAGAAPWEGINALDAAFLAYSNISVLRQQMKPDHRVHGIVRGKDWSPNVIPDYASMEWLVRAPTHGEVEAFSTLVQNCLKAAALATSCKVNILPGTTYYDLHQNSVLGDEFFNNAKTHYGLNPLVSGSTASTDFGNVCYALPAIHPGFSIPTEANGGNHTPAFTEAAASKEAHERTLLVTKSLALTGIRVLVDDQFFGKVKAEFEAWKAQA